MRCLGDGCSVVAAIAENLDKCRNIATDRVESECAVAVWDATCHQSRPAGLADRNSHVTVDKPMRSLCKRIEVRRRPERVTVPATGVRVHIVRRDEK